jgi:hypothetical protein
LTLETCYFAEEEFSFITTFKQNARESQYTLSKKYATEKIRRNVFPFASQENVGAEVAVRIEIHARQTSASFSIFRTDLGC